MITLNDYLYSGDTVLKILQKYTRDLRKEAKLTHNEIDLMHVNFLIQITENGPKGGVIFLAGVAVPVLLLGILFIFHMIGAGDIKLLCALGGIMGPRTVMECIVYSLLAGAGISLAILISTGGIRRRFLYLYQYMNEFYCTGEIRPYYRKGMSFPENFHFTVPIFLSAVLYAGGVY